MYIYVDGETQQIIFLYYLGLPLVHNNTNASILPVQTYLGTNLILISWQDRSLHFGLYISLFPLKGQHHG